MDLRRLAMPALSLPLVLAAAAGARAQGPTPPQGAACQPATCKHVVDHLQREYLSTYSGPWTNWTKVMKGGKDVPLGFFVGEGAQVFAGSPRALAEARTARTYRVAGTPLWVAGLALLVIDTVLISAKHSSVYDRFDGVRPLFYGLLAGGGALGLTGAFLIQAANGRIADAARFYNEDLFARAEQRFSFGLAPLAGGGATASLGVTF